MKKYDFIEYWVKSSKHDMKVSESLFKDKHFDYCLFLAHLSLEKILKALWVKNNIENIPPKTHNLVYLAQNSNINLDDDKLKFLQFINTFNISSRYPDYKFKIHKMCNKEYTDKNLRKIKEFYKCLTKKL